MNPESLTPSEHLPPLPHSAATAAEPVLSEQKITELTERQEAKLQELRPVLSRKLFFALEEKLIWEQKELRRLLDLQLGRASRQAKYSHVLDPQYFEQKFLNIK